MPSIILIGLMAFAFMASLFVLVKSADLFTDNSEQLGLRLGMSHFIIGATIVAVGTSLPELVSSLYAVINTGETSFVADAIVGSNIANALLIIGIGALFANPLKSSSSLIHTDIPLFFLSMGIFVMFVMDGSITFAEGIFLFAFFIMFVWQSIAGKDGMEDESALDETEEEITDSRPTWKLVVLIILAMGLVAVSAKYFIDSLLALSDLVGISSSLLTVTVVALGTSLPEVLTSIAAIKRGNHGMAIGNVFGSNTFNIALVGGLPALFSTLSVNEMTLKVGIPFLIFATLATVIAKLDDRVDRWEGVAMLFTYAVFMAKAFGII